MTGKDRRLLHEVARWAHTQGWRRLRYPHRWNGADRGWTDAPADWRYAPEEGANVVTATRSLLSVHRPGWDAPAVVPVTSVIHAVDVLVALRILPAPFSSAFRSGQTFATYLGKVAEVMPS